MVIKLAQRGFSLIELLVVTAVLVLISGLLLASNSRFGGVVQLESLAFDIGLSIRQSQVYGISVRQFSAGVYTAGYGMHFDMANPTTYVLYGDAVSANGLYDSGELVVSNAITRGYFVKSLCVTQTGLPEDCSVTQVDILFKRPEPDAYISAAGQSCILTLGPCLESARIVVESPRGDTMSIIISVNGQVSVTHQ
mgnify:CR=1 FL=1